MMPEWIKDVFEKAGETAHLCYLSQRVEIQHTHLYGFTNVTWITCG